MGGRGAASRTSKTYRFGGKDLEYGDEYFSIGKFQTSFGEVKLVMQRKGKGVTLPRETQTPGRIYALVAYNKDDEPTIRSIGVYDYEGKKSMQIDLEHPHRGKDPVEGVHVHFGYNHEVPGGKRAYSIDETPSAKKLMEEILAKYGKAY